MHANDRAVDENILEIGILRERVEQALPDARALPTCEALIDTVPVAEHLGQVTPRRTGAEHPQDGFHERPIVRRRASGV